MTTRSCLVVILAAGEGTRMRTSVPKVLHPVAGRTLLAHVLNAVPDGASAAVVIGPDHEPLAKEIKRVKPSAQVFVQKERLGTAHAALMAREALARGADDVMVVFGDTPLITKETLERLRAPLAEGAGVVVLGFRAADPTGYGRLVMKGDELLSIVEHRDASADQLKIDLCNGGVMALAGKSALAILDKIGNANAKGEYYLTDAVTVARQMGLRAVVRETTEDEVRGINTKAQLAEAEGVMQQKLRQAAMDAGVTMIAPETVFLAADTSFGKDVTIEPFVVFGPGVSVGDGTVIHSFSHITQAKIGKGVSVGPYARLRPGADLRDGARVGNFVEVKEAVIHEGAKVNHLTYIGDASVGAAANIGAGTITCNYDGFDKHRTEIGAGAFVGSNSSLVAPVKIGVGAYIGSGSVVTRNVPDGALMVERSQPVVKEGWVEKFRALKGGGKAHGGGKS
jgi:bifunctional UDP-N-acetylglucosamine pyrophosphorylase/glucosamine-1-phosphate N-acetyltransferase